jgi:tRNA pseudouridine55 synthase
VSVNGILNVLKPAGKTSFAVVSQLRRLSGEPRVGHAGTLDPDATGVLVVCLGQGTRIIEFLSRAGKSYRAEIELGITTDSYDASGRVVQRCDPSGITREQFEGVLHSFAGSFEQVPPMYSALKYKGKRLYQLAWQGIEVPRKPRKVHFSRLDLVQWEAPVATVDVECSAGTYIRSLAQDIGVSLGCGAHIPKLVRLKSEPFHIDDAVPIPAIEEAFRQGYWRRLLHAIDDVLADWEAVILSRDSEALVANGRSIRLGSTGASSQPQPVEWCRAYSLDGRFLAVLHQEEDDLWHPEKVFSSAGRGDAGCARMENLDKPCGCHYSSTDLKGGEQGSGLSMGQVEPGE